MARYRHIHNSFIGGEISPAAFGRTDLDLFGRSVADLKNMVVKSKGGAARRPGTQFIASSATKYNLTTGASLGSGGWSGPVRIIPFVFSREESYAMIIEQNTIAIINTNTLANATYSHDVALVTHNFFTGYASATQLEEIQFAQNGDLIWLVHPNHPPLLFARTATNTFIRYQWYDPPFVVTGVPPASVSPGLGWPYLTLNLNTAHTMTISGGLGTTLTSSVAFFTAAHVGGVIKLSTGGLTNYFFITAFTSTTVVTGFSGTAQVASGPFGPTSDWEESAFSYHRGWPRTVSFFEQRIYFAGTSHKPDTVYASEIADLFEMDARGIAPGFNTPATASDPFGFTVAATEVNQMQWLSPGRSLVMGTAGQEFIAQGSSGALSAIDISVGSESNYGSAYRQPIRSENVINFVSRNSLTIREFVFNRDQDSFTADDITRFSDHLSSKFLTLTAETNTVQFKYITKQDTGTIILWAVDKNGGLYGLSRDRFTGVNAWHYHVFGGELNLLAPKVQSITGLPSGDGTTDDLWLAITRDINAVEVTYIERINKEYDRDSILNSSTSIVDKALYADSAKMQQGAATNTITGLTHLEGEEVQVVADGFYLGTFTVTAGQVVVPDTYEEFIVGLAYESNLKTLPLEAGSGLGISQHAISRIDKIGIRFYNTIGAKFGYKSSDLETIIFRDPNTPMNEPTDLFTGDKVLDMTQDYDRRNEVIVKQDLPFPMHIVCMTFRGLTYD